MKRKLLYIALTVFLCLSILFCGLWMQEKGSTLELEGLCQYTANRASGRFLEYRDEGADYDYRYAVSELASFYNAYMYLTTLHDGETDGNCIVLNHLIGVLMDGRNLTQGQAEELAEAMAMLAKDIFDSNAFDRLTGVYYEMTQ